MEVTAEDKVLVAVRDDEACRSALEWCIQEFAGPRESSVCFLLTHVVTELRNTGTPSSSSPSCSLSELRVLPADPRRHGAAQCRYASSTGRETPASWFGQH